MNKEIAYHAEIMDKDNCYVFKFVGTYSREFKRFTEFSIYFKDCDLTEYLSDEVILYIENKAFEGVNEKLLTGYEI